VAEIDGEVKTMNYKNIADFWHKVPETVKVAVWVGISVGLTAFLSYLLEQPELAQYYGIINILLFALKEVEKKRQLKKNGE
jgi:hypothetical protein